MKPKDKLRPDVITDDNAIQVDYDEFENGGSGEVKKTINKAEKITMLESILKKLSTTGKIGTAKSKGTSSIPFFLLSFAFRFYPCSIVFVSFPLDFLAILLFLCLNENYKLVIFLLCLLPIITIFFFSSLL